MYKVIYQYAGDVTEMYEAVVFKGSLEAKIFADGLKSNDHFKNVKMIG